MQAALQHQHDVWANCVAEGIEQEILIDATLAMAIRESHPPFKVRCHRNNAQ